MVDSKTPVNELIGEEFEYNGTKWKIEKHNPDIADVDDLEDSEDVVVYKLICLGDDAPSGYEEQIKSRMLIGCPNCKENNYATFTSDGRYSCSVCDYDNELNIATFMAPR